MNKRFLVISMGLAIFAIMVLLAIGLALRHRLSDKTKQLSQFDGVVNEILSDKDLQRKIVTTIVDAHSSSPDIVSIETRYKNPSYGIGGLMTRDGRTYIVIYQTIHSNNNTGVDKVAVISEENLVGVYDYHLCCGLETFQNTPRLNDQNELASFLKR